MNEKFIPIEGTEKKLDNNDVHDEQCQEDKSVEQSEIDPVLEFGPRTKMEKEELHKVIALVQEANGE